MIGIVASIASVVTLLSILVAVHFFLQYRRRGRIQRAMQQNGIEGGPGLKGDNPHPAQPSWRAIAIINNPTPYPMEKFTSRPISPYLAQPAPNQHPPGSYRQMQSLNAATADLDQILNASTLTSNDGNRAWSSSSSSPSYAPHPRDVQDSDSAIRTTGQPKAATPVSPLSFTSNFMDSLIPMSYIRDGSVEADSGTGSGGSGNAARRSSSAVVIPGRGVMDRGGDHYI